LLPAQLLLVPSVTVVLYVSGVSLLMASLLLFIFLLLLAPCHVVGAYAADSVHAVASFPAVATLLLFLAILLLVSFAGLPSATNGLAS
jgi:hypothetical protein